MKHSKTTRQNQALTKRCSVIYTCLTARAIDLELTGDLSTDSFIHLLRCFISRRGYIRIMKLDSSTNFVVATTELKSLITLIIRSLESITNERTITKELLTTLLCEVENILNSRPSTSISDWIIDVEALTPSHILLGSSQPNIKPSNYENVEVNYRKKWRIEQVYTNLLWKGWLYEYLPTFSPRTK